jgi:hypothetical protein
MEDPRVNRAGVVTPCSNEYMLALQINTHTEVIAVVTRVERRVQESVEVFHFVPGQGGPTEYQNQENGVAG